MNDILHEPAVKTIIADTFYSGFEKAHDTYNAISTASDGNVYYVLSSNSLQPGRMYRYLPVDDRIEFLGDLATICSEAGQKVIPQGKSHSRFYEMDSRLYGATHVGFYETIGNFERLPRQAPDGYGLYPGGHFFSYDLQTGQFEDIFKVPNGEGIVTMNMDVRRGHLFGITWPTGRFVHYELATGIFTDLGPVSAAGEDGTPGEDYRVLCRSLLVDPRTGFVYFSIAEGDVFEYKPSERSLKKLDISLRLDYFGNYDYTRPGSMGYNWRKMLWHEESGLAYGVHGNSGYLFTFDPSSASIKIVERITSLRSRESGMYNLFTYGYLGFILGPDKNTIYYLTGSPVYENGRIVKGDPNVNIGSKGTEDLHLVTYHISEKKYTDHGAIVYRDGSTPSYVNSIALTNDGTIYTLGRLIKDGKLITDLIKIPPVSI